MAEDEGKVVVSTKNTFIDVQNRDKPDVPMRAPGSAPPVYRYPVDRVPGDGYSESNVPDTPEMWQVSPLVPVDETGEDMPQASGNASPMLQSAEGMAFPEGGNPFPTLCQDDDQAQVVGYDCGVGEMPVPAVTPHEKGSVDALKDSLAAMFRSTKGVMFMVTREQPYCFNVRLRMPAGENAKQAAEKCASKKAYPKTLQVVEASASHSQVDLLLFYLHESVCPVNAVCWDLIKKKQCPRLATCRWVHLPMSFFRIQVEVAPG